MDSFYDAPRRAPMPTQIEKFLPAPVVPEVSIICSSKTPANRFSSYNSWKMQQNRAENTSILTSNRENVVRGRQKFIEGHFPTPQNTSQFLKKQVRFESPVLQQRPSLSYEPFTKKTETQNSGNIVTKTPLKDGEKSNMPQQNLPLNGATFEQIYLSNIPNRNLDLSLIDLCKKQHTKQEPVKRIDTCDVTKQEPVKRIDTCDVGAKKNEDVVTNTSENKENMLPKTYREFLETQKKVCKENIDHNDSVTDIFNYKRKQFKKAENETGLPVDYAFDHNPSNIISPGDSKSKDSRNNGFNIEQQQVPPPAHRNNWYPDNRQQPNAENFLKNFGHSPKYDKDTQTSTVCPPSVGAMQEHEKSTKTDSEPSNRDLLKIIAQQNEQLLILQRQVAMLLNRDDQHQPKQIEAPRKNYLGENCITSTQNENFRNPMQDVNNTPKKQRGLSKFSIDLMTSFEVAIRPQHKQNFINHEPKIQEITESESGITEGASAVDKCEKTLVDTSLHFQEPLKVREVCPSPEPSININMNDYDSSDEDEVSASEIGATFYRNLMGQVNDILRKAQVQTKGEFREGLNCPDNFRNQAMNRVKEATLRHLKNIGVTIGPIEEIDEEVSLPSENKDYTPTEVSFAVKQLLMKYLPDEQLAKITYKQAQSAPLNKPGKHGVISNRPEFSFATVEYMKKYNLISNKDTKPKNIEQVPKPSNPQKPQGPKILDITALKMQPKLL